MRECVCYNRGMETLLRIAVLALLAGMAQFAVRRAWRAAMRAFRPGRVGAGAKAILIFMAVAGMLYSGDKDAPPRGLHWPASPRMWEKGTIASNALLLETASSRTPE